MSDLVINDSNFDQYFLDVRKHKWQKGQVMACYSATAELVEGPEKKNLVDLLCNTDKAQAATQVMRKLLCASEKDSIRIPKEIIQDLLNGVSYEDVLKKPYKYTFQMYFYTNPEYIPKDDPHWESISILNNGGDSRILTAAEVEEEDRKRKGLDEHGGKSV